MATSPPFPDGDVVIDRTDRGPVTILRMEHGKANAFDLALIGGLEAQLDAIAQDASYRSVVVTGTGSIFSAGVDLFRVVEGGIEYLDQFLPAFIRTFRKLFTLPFPVIAAINGHAIAGGCVLASACDFRLMQDGDETIGVPGLRVQVPFPSVAIEILRFAAASAHLQELVYLGKTYLARDAYQRGLIDEVVQPEMLLERATEVALRLHEIPAETFALAKAQVRKPAVDAMDRHNPAEDAKVLALWRSPDTHAAIERYLAERFTGSRR